MSDQERSWFDLFRLADRLKSVLRKRVLTLLGGGLFLLLGWQFFNAQINPRLTVGDLNFAVMDWYFRMDFWFMLWGMFLGWRLFAGESFARWDSDLAAKFGIFFLACPLPIFSLVFFCGRIWPETQQNVPRYLSFLLGYAESAALVAFAAFFSNSIAPGLVSTILGGVIAAILALFGAFLPQGAWLIFSLLVLSGSLAVYFRPRFEAGTLPWGQRLAFAFMAFLLVLLPTLITITVAFVSHGFIHEAMTEKFPSLGKSLAADPDLTPAKVETALTRQFFADGESDVFRKGRHFLLFACLTLVCGLTIFLKRFWDLQGKFETLTGKLSAQTAELEAILRGTKEGIIVTDAADRVVFMNDQGTAMLRLASDGILGKPFLETIQSLPHLTQTVPDPRQTPAGRSPLRTLIDVGNAAIEWQVAPLPVGPDGEEMAARRVYRLNCGIIAPSEKQVSTVVGVLHDMTLERHMQEAKNEFVRYVAHEFRTPLTSINGFTEMLLDEETPDPQIRKEYLAIIHVETNRLMRMINELLDIARIESGRREMKCEALDVAARLRHAASILESQVKMKRQTLELSLPENLPPLLADADLFQQALLNIVGNSIKYTPEGGRIQCRATVVGAHLCLAVSDSGIGISPEDQKRLGEKFFRIQSAQTPCIVGTGLGLAAVKSIMEAHHGRVEVQSAVGSGSTFTLVFPLTG